MILPSRRLTPRRAAPSGAALAALLLPLVFAAPSPATAQSPSGASARPAEAMERRYQQTLREHFAKEPSIAQVQQDAIDYAQAEPDRARSWFARSAWANLAPRRVQARLDRDFKETRTARSQERVETSATTDVDDDSLWQFTVEWDLSRLVFNPDTVRVASQSINLAELREDVLNAVTKLYFQRRALLLDLYMDPPVDFSLYAAKRMRADELTADIDALTGGAFSRRVEAAGRKR